jgi:hypothetical protein
MVMRDNVIALGPNEPPQDAAVLATEGTLELRGNRLENTTGRGQRLLLDWTHGSPALVGNVVGDGDTEVSSAGVFRHRAGGTARGLVGDVRAAAGATKRMLKSLVGR